MSKTNRNSKGIKNEATTRSELTRLPQVPHRLANKGVDTTRIHQ